MCKITEFLARVDKREKGMGSLTLWSWEIVRMERERWGRRRVGELREMLRAGIFCPTPLFGTLRGTHSEEALSCQRVAEPVNKQSAIWLRDCLVGTHQWPWDPSWPASRGPATGASHFGAMGPTQWREVSSLPFYPTLLSLPSRQHVPTQTEVTYSERSNRKAH